MYIHTISSQNPPFVDDFEGKPMDFHSYVTLLEGISFAYIKHPNPP